MCVLMLILTQFSANVRTMFSYLERRNFFFLWLFSLGFKWTGLSWKNTMPRTSGANQDLEFVNFLNKFYLMDFFPSNLKFHCSSFSHEYLMLKRNTEETNSVKAQLLLWLLLKLAFSDFNQTHHSESKVTS